MTGVRRVLWLCSFVLVSAVSALTMNGPVVVVGLNPALQRTITLAGLKVGGVNRAASVEVGIGGKGQNVIVASRHMQLQKPSQLLQFLGTGGEGDLLSNLLLERNVDPQHSVRVSASTRTCTTLVDQTSGLATEIVEPSGKVDEQEIQALLRAAAAFKGQGASLAVMGSMPPGCTPALYAQILRAAADSSSKVLLDCTVGVPEALQACKGTDGDSDGGGNLGCPTMLKTNVEELLQLCGLPPIDCPSPMDLLSAARTLTQGIARGGLFLAVTDGPRPAFFVSTQTEEVFKLTLPPLGFQIVNPIGAGDAVASGTIHNWANALAEDPTAVAVEGVRAEGEDGGEGGEGARALRAFAWGIACGTASCATNSNSVFDAAVAHSVFRSLQIAKV